MVRKASAGVGNFVPPALLSFLSQSLVRGTCWSCAALCHGVQCLESSKGGRAGFQAVADFRGSAGEELKGRVGDLLHESGGSVVRWSRGVLGGKCDIGTVFLGTKYLSERAQLPRSEYNKRSEWCYY